MLIVTDGSKGTWDPDIDPVELVRSRQAEQAKAADALGATGEIVMLGHTDGELVNTLELREQIALWIRRLRPDVVLSHDPWKRYMLHPDHRATGMGAVDAIVAARDHLFFTHQLTGGLDKHRPDALLLWAADEPDHWEDISETFEAKVAALLCHSSQSETTMGNAHTGEDLGAAGSPPSPRVERRGRGSRRARPRRVVQARPPVGSPIVGSPRDKVCGEPSGDVTRGGSRESGTSRHRGVGRRRGSRLLLEHARDQTDGPWTGFCRVRARRSRPPPRSHRRDRARLGTEPRARGGDRATALDTVARRLRSGNILFDGGEDATCCDDYLTDIWVTDPDGFGWEVADAGRRRRRRRRLPVRLLRRGRLTRSGPQPSSLDLDGARPDDDGSEPGRVDDRRRHSRPGTGPAGIRRPPPRRSDRLRRRRGRVARPSGSPT